MAFGGKRNRPDSPGAGDPTQGAESAEDFREKWLRAAAELDNVRKRARAKIQTTVAHERREMLAAFLDVVDSLDHALVAHEGEDNEWVRGTRSIRAQALEVLKRFGAKPFRSKGEPFDPERHEAVGSRAEPSMPEGAIVEVLRSGYELRDGVLLRPARVVVNQTQDASGA